MTVVWIASQGREGSFEMDSVNVGNWAYFSQFHKQVEIASRKSPDGIRKVTQ